tara:strand:- start:437 stop:793 length:357 start_codon:yes stop_codon:yes gene_type:complete
MKLNDEAAEKYLEEYRKHGMDYAYHNAELKKNEQLLEFRKAQNFVSIKSSSSITQAKNQANANENLKELMDIVAVHELEREKSYTQMHYYRMKFEGWKAETFKKSNDEYFEQKVYAKT